MKKALKVLAVIVAVIVALFVALSVVVFITDKQDEKSEKEEKERVDNFFEIVDMINNGEYEDASTAIHEQYDSYDYTGIEGARKEQLYRLFYRSQEQYEEEMDVLLEYLEANDFKNHLKSEDGSYYEDIDPESFIDPMENQIAIREANSILDYVSEETRAKAIEVIGQDILDQYGDYSSLEGS